MGETYPIVKSYGLRGTFRDLRIIYVVVVVYVAVAYRVLLSYIGHLRLGCCPTMPVFDSPSAKHAVSVTRT